MLRSLKLNTSNSLSTTIVTSPQMMVTLSVQLGHKCGNHIISDSSHHLYSASKKIVIIQSIFSLLTTYTATAWLKQAFSALINETASYSIYIPVSFFTLESTLNCVARNILKFRWKQSIPLFKNSPVAIAFTLGQGPSSGPLTSLLICPALFISSWTTLTLICSGHIGL